MADRGTGMGGMGPGGAGMDRGTRQLVYIGGAAMAAAGRTLAARKNEHGLHALVYYFWPTRSRTTARNIETLNPGARQVNP